jgi:hypothetical protein
MRVNLLNGKSAVLAIMFLVPVLAGCIAEPGPENTTPPVEDPLPFTVPDLPAVDVDHLFAMYKPFVTTYNTRKDNHPDHIGARADLEKKFGEMGLEVIRHNYTQGGLAQANIIGIKWGYDRENWVVVGAHFDTTTNGDTHDEVSQGAYDDGSGTMLVMELANSYKNITPYYTIAFAEFDGEERGLRGSAAFYRDVTENKFPYTNITFHAMLNLDMIGINWPVCAPIYFDQNNAALKTHVMAAAKAMGIPDGMIKPQGITLGQSDYAHWYKAGVPTAFFISDFQELAAPGIGGSTPAGCLPAAPGAYPFWHTADNWETMEFMAGGAAQLKAGFKTALKLSAETLHFMSADPANVLKA